MKNRPAETRYQWYILALATLTNTLVAAAPGMCMSVLFAEISRDLHLDLVQVGLIWGIGSLPGIVTVLLGGAIGDRFGPKRVLLFSCLMVGLTGALRGLAGDFISLLAAMFVFGVFAPFISMNTLKCCGMWFPRSKLGLASGVLSMGMAMGFLGSSILSASVLSPWLGGWRHVLYLYGAIAVALCVPWYFSRIAPESIHAQAGSTGLGQGPGQNLGRSLGQSPRSLRQNLVYISRIRNIWLFGLAILGFNGCVQGALGYLPLYLRGLGWPGASADAALGSFHTLSMLCVVPIALLSDRLGSRKKILLAAVTMMTLGVGLLSTVGGAAIWAAIGIAGMVRDGFMAVFITSIIETEGVGPAYAGTATGMVMVFSNIGSLIAPPIGNSLASAAPGLPFVFWAALMLLAFAGLVAAREKNGAAELALD